MGCAASTSFQQIAQPTETIVSVGSALQEEESAHQHDTTDGTNTQLSDADNKDLAEHIEPPATGGLSHNLDDEREDLAPAKHSAKRFAHTYVRALSMQSMIKDVSSRAYRAAQRRDSLSGDAQHSEGPSSSSLSVAAAAPEKPTSNRTSNQNRCSLADKLRRESPIWIDASAVEDAARDFSVKFSLQQAYTREFEDKPPRLRPMLREARKKARARAPALANAAGGHKKNVDSAQGTCLTQINSTDMSPCT
jgi:hypothetical protein